MRNQETPALALNFAYFLDPHKKQKSNFLFSTIYIVFTLKLIKKNSIVNKSAVIDS